MRIVVTANGAGLDAAASPVFGRCPAYVFVDTDTMQCESVENPAVGASGGADGPTAGAHVLRSRGALCHASLLSGRHVSTRMMERI
jgi:predicted Fe-Mo cluster-binding NifX family protein